MLSIILMQINDDMEQGKDRVSYMVYIAVVVALSLAGIVYLGYKILE